MKLSKKKLPDVQAHAPKIKGIYLNRVGVTNVPFPLYVRGKKDVNQKVKAMFNIFGSLKHNVKGTNMSRFAEILTTYCREPYVLTAKRFGYVLGKLRDSLNRGSKYIICNDVYMKANFSYYTKTISPVSKKESYMYYDCAYIGVLKDKRYSFILEIQVPVTLLCPCSKLLSLTEGCTTTGKGAHNQRALITVQVQTKSHQPNLSLIDIIKAAEDASSSRLYTVLKRPDEKYVTEYAYSHPKFVEDAARETVFNLKNRVKNLSWLRVRVESFESIHLHNAVAYCEQFKRNYSWIKTDFGFK